MNRKIVLLISLLFFGCHFIAKGQASICPPNVNFEEGNLSIWNFENGTVATGPIYTLVATAPVTPWEELTGPAPANDYYGNFPTVAPGGGVYSCHLGRGDTNNNCAERATYYVDIPAGTTIYSLVYHYAAVLEVPTTGHTAAQEPRFVVGAYDSALGTTIPCAAYTYVSGTGASGFLPSTKASLVGNGFDVVYKPWTFGNMKFPGENGRTVAIEFTANDCTLGAHFGYGYFDMSCGLFASVISCGTTTETLTAPPGFASYQWLDSTTLSVSYGTTQSITVAAPTSPTTYAVIITPFTGYGCPDTLYSRLIPSNLSISPSDDTTICSGNTVLLNPGATDIDTPLTFNWAPSTGLSCSSCATASATPTTTTAYTVTVSDPGGCSLTHVFNVTVFPTPGAIIGNLNACLGSLTTLSDGVGAGVWSSSNVAAATIGSSSGIITGVSLDTTTITYSFGGGLCATSSVVTVNPLPLPITGSVPFCAGSSITLGDLTSGGVWSSSAAGIAAVNSTSGVVSGVSVAGGNAIITYTDSAVCSVNIIVTVNPLSPITGATHVCPGLTIPLSDATPGGTWTSSNNAVATVGTSGVVTGVATPGGVDTITYTTPAGCTTTFTITVNPAAAAITGIMSICPGTTTTLSDVSTGGAWSSSSGATASVGSTSGLVTGGTAATTTITYTLASGCLITAIVTVNPTPPAITGAMAVCSGSASLLHDGITGGTWSSSNTAIATVGSSSGVLGGVAVSLSTTTITYTSPAGCTTSTVITVNPLPAVITGTAVICAGQSTTLHDATTGGTWTSGNTAVATIDPSSGATVAVSSGTSVIIYTLPTGCTTTIILTVNVTPVPITGTLNVCVGATTLLADATTGGTWSSGTVANATVNSSTGVVYGTGTLGGLSTITYALATGCSATAIVTVNPLPALFTVTGGGAYCAGGTGAHVGLSGSTTGINYVLYNGAFIAGGPVVGTGASIDFGPETAAGTYTIVATNPVTGCTNTMTGSATVTINPVPPAFTVTGGGSFCAGTTGVHVGLSGSTVGVNYQFHDGLFVGPIKPGTGSPIDFGVETIAGTYTVFATYPITGCTSTMTGTATVTVLPLPTIFSVTGGGGYCAGGSGVPVGLSGSSVGITYNLYNSITGVASTGGTGSPLTFGLQTTPGAYFIVAENTATSCFDTMTGVTVFINPLPAPIAGPGTVCVGATITETDDSTGGAWISGTVGNATVGSASGIVTGLTSASTTVITYVLPTGCTATRTITVSLSPSPVSSPSSVCVGSTITETDAAPTGVWSSSNTADAIVGSVSGVVAGVSSGVISIINTIPSTGCTMSAPVTVNPLPAAIGGTTHVCVGLTTILGDVTTGGVWSAGAYTGVASVPPTPGAVRGVSGGTAVITYTLPTSCAVNTVVTVYPSPAAISGPTSVCQGFTITAIDVVTGGTWSSSNTSVASIGATGLITTGLPGSTTITYTMPGNCTASELVTVNPISAVTGPGIVCQGSTITLSDAATGGTWSSATTTVATVNAGGVVSGVAPGVVVITYTTAAGCTASATITVNLTPTPITGIPAVCAGAPVVLGDGITGGTWSITNTAVATLTGGVVVWGATAGNTTLTYALPDGCFASVIVTVNPLPLAITGTETVCSGLTTTLHDLTTGGTWSSGAPSVGTVDPITGVVLGAVSGPATIYYTITATGCKTSAIVTVNPLPAPITGPASICVGYTTILNDATTGGAWSSSVTAVATVGTGAGVVYGVTPGTTIITYTIPTGCVATNMVTVVPVPAGITGAPMVCEGSVTLMSVPGAPGGTWTTGVASIATIGFTSGYLTGVASGTVIVSYTIGAGCNVLGSIIVDALSPITGDSILCVGETATLTDTTQDGVWSSINPAVATAVTSTLTTGSYTGVLDGTATIKYTLPTGCVAIYIVTINPLPAEIFGVTDVCVASTTALTDFTSGGTWSSSNTLIATVDSVSGVVTGIAPGPVTISYIVTATGCPRTITVMVNALPVPISGPSYVCPGSTISLSDIGTGTWSSVPTSVGTVGETSGVFTGVSPGSATVTYTLPITGCSTSSFITVVPYTDPIMGNRVACLGSTTILSDGTMGGVWSSSNTFIAPVGLFSGSVTGSALGTATITYTTSLGCTITAMITVDPSPAFITGPSVVCQGSTMTLNDATSGGTWSSIPSTIATVDSVTGVVTGILGGAVTVYYTLGGVCSASAYIVVNPLPAAITGATHVCATGTGNLYSAPGGGTWTSSNTAVATVYTGAGFVTGASAGLTTITYTLSTGCLVSEIITVDPMPTPISGPASVCAGSTITLANTVSGGSWSSTIAIVATIGSLTGVVTGVAAGPTNIFYTIGACSVSAPVNVRPLPAIFDVTGGGPYCAGGAGSLIGLNGSAVGILYYLYHGATATGTFAGTGTSLNFGLQSVAGTYTVVAVSSSTTCSSTMAGSALVTITPTVTPSVSFTDTPGTTVCAGTTVTFRSVPVLGGGTPVYEWSVNGVEVSSATNYSFIPANGDVVTVAMTSDALCPLPAVVTHSVTMTVSLPGLPEVSVAITPGDTVCQGTNVILTAMPVRGGSSPVYSWVKDGVASGADPIYSFVPANGDVVYCELTSNYPCRLADTAVSNNISMVVDTPMTPVVTISASPGTSIGIGKFDTLTASVENGGPSPSYQWVVNGLPVAGATTNTYISDNYSYPNEDSISCVVTADDPCRISSFQWVYIYAGPLGITPVSGGADDIAVIPNPNKGQFTVKGSLGITNDAEVSLEITDMLGQVVYKSMVLTHNGTLNEHVALSNGIANGMYLLNVNTGTGNKVFHLVIEQ